MSIGSACITSKPSAHINLVAATIAKTSRLPAARSVSQYFTRSSRPSLVAHWNFTELPPSSLPRLANVQSTPASASAAVNGNTSGGPARMLSGERSPGSFQIVACARYASRARGLVRIADTAGAPAAAHVRPAANATAAGIENVARIALDHHTTIAFAFQLTRDL